MKTLAFASAIFAFAVAVAAPAVQAPAASAVRKETREERMAKLQARPAAQMTEAKVFEGAGTSGADVASVIVLGQYAYGYTSLTGSNPRVIVKPAGSAGTGDPLDQISTVGWKMDGFGVKLIQPEYAVRIECGIK